MNVVRGKNNDEESSKAKSKLAIKNQFSQNTGTLDNESPSVVMTPIEQIDEKDEDINFFDMKDANG